MSSSNKEEQALKLFIVLSKAYRTLEEKVMQDIRSHGLNPTEFAVLELLYHKGPQPLQKIGSKILITSGSITYVTDKLESKGYLTRKPCTNDRRITYGTITDKGRKLMDEIFPAHRKRIAELTEALSLEEKDATISNLKKLGLQLENEHSQ
ncbi:MarR family winged helix-turn-helix transcriptional regulator [Bacillus marinisedimentorum]|uniref:MarR family winged helix-turn-helix transcriptional regulator n=1 Tax=Bacillus marinisedimentorum TaxID=1821260 RepID=UPI003CCBED7E